MSLHADYKNAIATSGKSIAQIAELRGNKCANYERINNWIKSERSQFANLERDLAAVGHVVIIVKTTSNKNQQ